MATNKTIKKKVPQVSWQQAMQQANKQDDYLRTLGLDPSALSPAQRAQALLNYDLTPAVAKEVKKASIANVSKTNKKQTIPYKEVNSASADVFRDVVLPLVANPLPFVTSMGVPSNISQMAAKTILGDARMSNSSLTDAGGRSLSRLLPRSWVSFQEPSLLRQASEQWHRSLRISPSRSHPRTSLSRSRRDL